VEAVGRRPPRRFAAARRKFGLSRSITVRLKGGLGNQMFQFACGYALAESYGLKLRLEFRGAGGEPTEFSRSYELGAFGIPLHAQEETRPPSILERFLPAKIIKEESFGETLPVPPMLAGSYVLDGYWQSEFFFESHVREIREQFSLRAIPESAKKLAQQIRSCPNAVVVQVRRGDYAKDDEVRAVHGLQPLSYFYDAVDRLGSTQPVEKVFVFSDDPEWCRDTFTWRVPAEVVDLSGHGHGPAVDLRLMSQGKRFVISNSSFGWWGAWLAGVAPGNVVAPRQWFADQRLSTSRLIPAGWQRV
jgi:Glycosyl transferase family 11